MLVRAATQDREMAAALGVNQRCSSPAVFALGARSPGWAARSPSRASRRTWRSTSPSISDAFVVVVVGGLGSIPGAFLAALLIGEVKAFCIGLGYSKLTLAVEFIVMAVVLVLRPWGLLGRPQRRGARPGRCRPPPPRAFRRIERALGAVALALLRRAAARSPGGTRWCC